LMQPLIQIVTFGTAMMPESTPDLVEEDYAFGPCCIT
jgi:hypothetical protein